jgi:hypothetical protein
LARQELAEQIRAAAALPKRLLLVEFSNDPQAPFVPSSYATYACICDGHHLPVKIGEMLHCKFFNESQEFLQTHMIHIDSSYSS